MQDIIQKIRENLAGSGVTVTFRSVEDPWVEVPHGSRVTYLSGAKSGVAGNRVEVPIREGRPSVQVLTAEVLQPPVFGPFYKYKYHVAADMVKESYRELLILGVHGENPRWGAILVGAPYDMSKCPVIL